MTADSAPECSGVTPPSGTNAAYGRGGSVPPVRSKAGRPQHPRELLQHSCMRGRFASGAMIEWMLERDDETVRADPLEPLLVQTGGATGLAVDAAAADSGIVYLFGDRLRPTLIAASSKPCRNRGGRALPASISTIPAAASRPCRSARSWTLSRNDATCDRTGSLTACRAPPSGFFRDCSVWRGLVFPTPTSRPCRPAVASGARRDSDRHERLGLHLPPSMFPPIPELRDGQCAQFIKFLMPPHLFRICAPAANA